MNSQTPFDSIEGAHAFVALLAKAVAESKQDVEADIRREAGSNVPRRLDALRITLYNLKKLEAHISRSRRILNDLRSLRRLLLEERSSRSEDGGKIRDDTQQAHASANASFKRKSAEDDGGVTDL